MKYTERALNILQEAEKEAEKTNTIVYPIHLLLGLLKNKTWISAELYLNYPELYEQLNERMKTIKTVDGEKRIWHAPFERHISHSTKDVLEKAKTRMEHFHQVYINEGHIVESIFRLQDPLTESMLAGLEASRILEVAAIPRDMIVSLKHYELPAMKGVFDVRKASSSDAELLQEFVEKEFGSAWIRSIKTGLEKEDIPIFIALQGKEIVGFACFDVVRNRKGVFGPMGTSRSVQNQGAGYTLLHCCLKEMKKIGYEYAVI